MITLAFIDEHGQVSDLSTLELDELRQGLQLRQSQLAKLLNDVITKDLDVPYDIQRMINERGETTTKLLNQLKAASS